MEPLRHADRPGGPCRHSACDVLDRYRLRADGQKRHVLDRASSDQAGFANERLNAAFRYALVRLRDAAEAVGFYRGEEAERSRLRQRFMPIIDNYRHYVSRTIGYFGWNVSITQTMVPLPWLIQAPRLFAGKIGLGSVAQTAAAFGTIQDSFSFFRNNYNRLPLRASIIRLHGLVDANARGRELPEVTVEPSESGSVEIAAVEVRAPSGEQLIDPLEVRPAAATR